MTFNSRKPNPNSKGQRLRIIGGEWRSRVLPFPDVPDIRPTPDRVRETLFNWLQYDIREARCLDLFAGSGILSFEALSRGAAEVVTVEQEPRAVSSIQQNSKLLKTTQLKVQQTDAMQWLQHSEVTPFNLAFIDPPFAAGLQQPCCELLAERGWLVPGALVYLEAGDKLSNLQFPEGWTLLKEKRAGGVHFGLLKT